MTHAGSAMPRRSADDLKVFLTSSDQVLIVGVQSVLADFATIAHGSAEDLKSIQNVAPHLIILDISGNAKKVDLLPGLKEVAPSAKMILLAGLDDIGSIFGADSSGIDGIVLTTQPPEVLLRTCQHLASVPRRENTMPTEGNNQRSETVSNLLTKQQQKIVELVSQGLSNKEIADCLCIAPITVRHHLTKIFDKLGVAGRQRLIIKSLEWSTPQLLIRPLKP